MSSDPRADRIPPLHEHRTRRTRADFLYTYFSPGATREAANDLWSFVADYGIDLAGVDPDDRLQDLLDRTAADWDPNGLLDTIDRLERHFDRLPLSEDEWRGVTFRAVAHAIAQSRTEP